MLTTAILQLAMGRQVKTLVLEDDARPVSKRVLDYYRVEEILGLAHLPEQWIVTLWLRGISRYQEYDATFHEIVASYANAGLVGYILTPPAAKILVDHFPTISCPVDQYVLGVGFVGWPAYKVLVSRKNLVRHSPGASLRNFSQRPWLERLWNKGRAVIDWL